jgi:hypothetical protein
MSRSRRLGRLGGLVAVAAIPFAGLWLVQVRNADDPMTVQTKLDVAIWMAVFGTPWMIAAWLLWQAWWRRAGATVSEMDGPARLLAAAAATLPAGRREWGAAMTAELTQIQERIARWRFAAGGARAAVFPPAGDRAAVIAAGTIAVAATATATLAAVKIVPAGRVFAPAFVGLLGGLATLAVARPHRAGPGPAVAGLALAGVAGCVAATTWYLAEHPSTPHGFPPTVSATLPPVTAVVLAVVLAGCLWLALRPPRWLAGDRRGRRFGVGMALALVAGFVLVSRLRLRGAEVDAGVLSYLLAAAPLVLLAGAAGCSWTEREGSGWAPTWATRSGGR